MRAASVAFDCAERERGSRVPENTNAPRGGVQRHHSQCEKKYSSVFVPRQEENLDFRCTYEFECVHEPAWLPLAQSGYCVCG
jgi:hypothetical protein